MKSAAGLTHIGPDRRAAGNGLAKAAAVYIAIASGNAASVLATAPH